MSFCFGGHTYEAVATQTAHTNQRTELEERERVDI